MNEIIALPEMYSSNTVVNISGRKSESEMRKNWKMWARAATRICDSTSLIHLSSLFFLQELIKHSRVLGEDTTDLERALELMLWIPTRCNDLKFITNIEGFHGNLHKLGRLIRHVSFLPQLLLMKKEGRSKERKRKNGKLFLGFLILTLRII